MAQAKTKNTTSRMAARRKPCPVEALNNKHSACLDRFERAQRASSDASKAKDVGKEKAADRADNQAYEEMLLLQQQAEFEIPSSLNGALFQLAIINGLITTLTEAESCYEKEYLERRISRLLFAVAMLIRSDVSGAEIENNLRYFMGDYLNPHTADEELQRAE